MIDRIKKIIEKEGSNPSSFADFIGISRSSMNHILNGRNNPSLDVLMKILSKYENINSDWLIFGKGTMYKGEKAFLQPSLFDETPVNPDKVTEPREYPKEIEVKQPPVEPQKTVSEEVKIAPSSDKKITQIIIFYSDATFDSLNVNH